MRSECKQCTPGSALGHRIAGAHQLVDCDGCSPYKHYIHSVHTLTAKYLLSVAITTASKAPHSCRSIYDGCTSCGLYVKHTNIFNASLDLTVFRRPRGATGAPRSLVVSMAPPDQKRHSCSVVYCLVSCTHTCAQLPTDQTLNRNPTSMGQRHGHARQPKTP